MKRTVKSKRPQKPRKLYLTAQPRLRPIIRRSRKVSGSDSTEHLTEAAIESAAPAPISQRVSLIESVLPLRMVPDRIDDAREIRPVVERTAVPVAIAAIATAAQPSCAEDGDALPPDSLVAKPLPPPPAFGRDFRYSLWVPVLISAAIIAATSWFPAPGMLWGQPATSPAFVRASIPAGAPPQVQGGIPIEALKPLSPATPEAMVALVTVPPVSHVSDVGGGEIEAHDADFLPRTRACSKTEVAVFAHIDPPQSPASFGAALASAAEAQVGDFVVYNDDYRDMHYPGGDIAPLYGVCSDVVIRAYRTLGVDLQRLVHEARVGSGDTSIDHRRTETLRRFFAKRSMALPVTDYAEDYLPGDVVTYDRPQNRHGQSHIAVVSSVTGPSGRRMIVHNRGWGPQMEDALFVDEVTGHYRFAGTPTQNLAAEESAKPARRAGNSRSVIVRRAAVLRSVGRGNSQKSKPRL